MPTNRDAEITGIFLYRWSSKSLSPVMRNSGAGLEAMSSRKGRSFSSLMDVETERGVTNWTTL